MGKCLHEDKCYWSHSSHPSFAFKLLGILRCVEEIEKLELLQREMPALWPILTSILDLEGTKYLPRDVSRVVLLLLHIRTLYNDLSQCSS